MTELALTTAPPGHAAATLVSPADTRWLLLGLALATGMEFYTFDSVNLVLPDMTGTLGLSTQGRCRYKRGARTRHPGSCASRG